MCEETKATSLSMGDDEHLAELWKLYKMAEESRQIGLALDILNQILAASKHD